MHNNPQQPLSSRYKQKCAYCTLTQIRVKQISRHYENLLIVKQQQLAASYQAISSLENVIVQRQKEKQGIISAFKQSQVNSQQQFSQLHRSIGYLKNREKELIQKIGKLQNELFIVNNREVENTHTHTSRINSQKSLNLCVSNSAKNLNVPDSLNERHKMPLSLNNHSYYLNIGNMRPQMLQQHHFQERHAQKDVYKKQKMKLVGQILNLKDQNDILRLKQRIALMRAMQFSVISLK